MKTLLFISGLLVSAFASAQENCGFPVSLIRSGFESGEQAQFVALPAENTPLTINIIAPLNGDVIPIDRVQVYGSFTGPANTGIMVAGQLAWSNATQFSTRPIVLVPGANTLTVTAKTLDGGLLSATRNITITPSLGADVQLRANVTGAYAPESVTFALTTRFPLLQTQITRVQVDYQGDGSFELDTPTPPQTPLQWNYDAPGVYLATARVSFDDGNPNTPLVVSEGKYRIQMQSLAYARQTLCGVYYQMKNRLIANQVPLALNTLGTRIKPRFQTLWTSLGATLPTVAANLGQIATGQISDVSAEFMMAIPDTANPGDFLGYPVLFTRGSDGVWRIYGM